jgi:hypothetical protein
VQAKSDFNFFATIHFDCLLSTCSSSPLIKIWQVSKLFWSILVNINLEHCNTETLEPIQMAHIHPPKLCLLQARRTVRMEVGKRTSSVSSISFARYLTMLLLPTPVLPVKILSGKVVI